MGTRFDENKNEFAEKVKFFDDEIENYKTKIAENESVNSELRSRIDEMELSSKEQIEAKEDYENQISALKDSYKISQEAYEEAMNRFNAANEKLKLKKQIIEQEKAENKQMAQDLQHKEETANYIKHNYEFAKKKIL